MFAYELSFEETADEPSSKEDDKEDAGGDGEEWQEFWHVGVSRCMSVGVTSDEMGLME